MSRYRKAGVAVLGALAQVAVVLADATDSGLIPAGWEPWVRVVLALATAFGVYRVPNVTVASGRNWGVDGRHELGRREDGRAVTVLVVTAAVLLLLAVPASAHYRRPVVAPTVTAVQVCDDGVLVVGFDAASLVGRQWVPMLDQGDASLQLHEVSGRSGPGGVWGPPPSVLGPVVSGGEHRLRWPGWASATRHGLHYDLLRVAVGGYLSAPAPIEETCTSW